MILIGTPRLRTGLSAICFLGLFYPLWLLLFAPLPDITGLAIDPKALSDPKERAELVRKAFIHGWEGYRKHAFRHDTLQPLSNGFTNNRNGWGSTAVDSLSTSILLEVPEAVDAALHHIAKINWKISPSDHVSTFGSTIRYMAGMLSAYDLLTTTHKHLIPAKLDGKVNFLVEQTSRLADVLAPSFATPKGINTNFLHRITGNNTPTDRSDIDITVLSGLVLEWTRLSDLTKNKTYTDLALKSMDVLLHPKPENGGSPLPGLLPKRLDIQTGVFNKDSVGGWSHAGGGYCEMLMKLSIYSPSRFGHYRKNWIAAADSTIKHLASHPRGREDLIFLAEFNGTQLNYYQDHSGMFAAASFILGGVVTGEKRFLDFGLQLVETYVKIYGATRTGIGPDSFSWMPSTCDTGEKTRQEVCEIPREYNNHATRAFVKRSGYWITNSGYLIRPEVLESLYYAYRATGDEKYREMSWTIINNVIRWCKAGSAYAELEDVDAKLRVGVEKGRRDRMNSYALTEVFMYAYIIHKADAPWHLKKGDNMGWVFSTQAHPLKVDLPKK